MLRLTPAVVLMLSLTCSLVWGKPPVKSQKGNTAVPSSAPSSAHSSSQQQDTEIFSGVLPGEMETDLSSTLCSGLWTNSIHESWFLPQFSTQPGTSARTGKQLTHAGKLKSHSQRKPRGKNRLTKSGKLGVAFTDHDSEPESGDTPRPSVPPSPGDAERDEELMLDEEPPLTLAECSRLLSAYLEHPELQDFLDSGRHAATQTTAGKTGCDGLKLDTVIPADEQTPFPDLTSAALDTLTQLSPTIHRLNQQLREGNDPLADKAALKVFLNEADQNSGELFAGGNHSLVIKWRKGPGYVLKIARSRQDSFRLKREQDLYLWLRDPDNVLLNLTTTPMRAAFSVHGKPVLALRQVDGTARDRLRLMKNHSLNERLDFALSVIMHFCQMYRRFLEKDVLLADRHEDNIGFNEIPLPGRKSMGLDNAIIQVPVMLDLDPYWFGDQETRMIQMHLPTWVPIVVGLLEEVFTPVNSNGQISESRVKVIDKIRQLASPIFPFSLSSSALLEIEEGDIESVIQNCINHWFQNANPEYSNLLAEARPHIECLLTSLNQWESTPRTVTEWNKRLQENIGEVFQWLNNWKNQTRLSLLNDFTDEGIIRVPSAQGGTFPRDRQILNLLSMIHGKLACQKCSRTFTSNKEFRRHQELHQQEKFQHCDVCGGDFTHITDHKRVHTGEKPYKCGRCSKCFSQGGSLQVHLRTHSGDKPYKCGRCCKCFSENTHLQRHLRAHSGDKPYKCEHCGKCFSRSSHLKTHIRTHSGDKPYKCEHCGKCFSENGCLQTHLRTHSGDKPYKCEHCGKEFSQSSHLKGHLRTHSGDKPYKCEHCGKCFSEGGNLQQHLRIHSGDKPYKCEHCGKCFSQSSSLQQHLRTHSGDKPYKCMHCGKGFGQNRYLKSHLHLHSRDES